jgi:putative endonuclease
MKSYYVYILATKKDGVLYIGFTGDIARRINEHKERVYDGFTKKYNVLKLVYYEKHLTLEEAMRREKQMKKWNRQWKINLIVKENPDWDDIFFKLPKKLSVDEIMKALFKDKSN